MADVMEEHSLQFKTFRFHNINLHVIQLVTLHVYCACKWCNPPHTLVNHLQSLPPFPFYPNDTIAPNDVLFPGNRRYSLSSLVTPSSLLSALCPLLSARIHQHFHFALRRRQRSLLCQDVNFQKKIKKRWKKRECSGMTVHPRAFCDISRWPETVLDKPSKERTNKDPTDGKGTRHGTLINVHRGCAEKQPF